ncbi:MAG: Rid family hydrolase [Proteobacteria bacterium]|nr:Rid family hydrolase [Pseudomonadota bacterium]
MEKEIINVAGASRPEGPDGKPLAPISLAVRAGDFVYVSGLPPIDMATGNLIEGDIKAQTRQSLENVKTVLEAAGTDLSKVVKATVYCSNAGYWGKVNEVYAEFFPTDPPARTFVAVGSWMMAFDIEIECIAIG